MFKIGEKVVCIDDKPRHTPDISVKRNEIYTVQSFNLDDFGLVLKEIKSKYNIYGAYSSNRFRKLDYEFVEEVIKQCKPETIEI